ncbi:MAG: aldo/keto reductase [Spirochaetes bacterium]|nr:aldo/keto reductase [Spirochaetota bacterium]
MEYRMFGRTGVMVSAIALGTMNFGNPTSEEESIRILQRAVDAGVNFIDTANVYNNGESERIVGKAVRLMKSRDKLFIATKVYNPMGEGPNDRGVSRYHILQECENSLKRLATDHIDLYQLHRPCFSIPQEETLRALDDLIHQGKVRYIGTSTFPAWKIMEGFALSERYLLNRYVSEQSPYNLLDRRIENELVPFALHHGLAIIAWSPLAGGVLTGRYSPGEPVPSGSRGEWGARIWKERINEEGKRVAAQLKEYAKEKGLTAAQMAFLWVKDQPGICAPLLGPRTIEHLESALEVVDKRLDPEDMAFCDTLVPPGKAVADFFNTSGWMK